MHCRLGEGWEPDGRMTAWPRLYPWRLGGGPKPFGASATSFRDDDGKKTWLRKAEKDWDCNVLISLLTSRTAVDHEILCGRAAARRWLGKQGWIAQCAWHGKVSRLSGSPGPSLATAVLRKRGPRVESDDRMDDHCRAMKGEGVKHQDPRTPNGEGEGAPSIGKRSGQKGVISARSLLSREVGGGGTFGRWRYDRPRRREEEDEETKCRWQRDVSIEMWRKQAAARDMGFPIPSHSILSVEGPLSLTENRVPTAGCC